MEENKKSISSETIQQNFDDLPHDMVLLLSSKFFTSFFDMLSLKEVCSSWRIAMKNSTKTTYPMIVSLAETKRSHADVQINNEFSLFCMNNAKKHYGVEKSYWFEEYYCKILGSHPDGWVILLDQSNAINLLHLLLKIKIELPNMATRRSTLVEIPQESIKKVIFSNDLNRIEDFIAVMRIDYYYDLKDTKLCFWRRGDSSWTCFGGDFVIFDIALCKNTLYAIRGCPSGNHRYLEAWDLKNNNCLPENKFSIELFDNHSYAEHLVVSSEDEVFLWSLRTFRTYTKGFISKLDLSKKECISVDSLNGRTLFSCLDNSRILSASDVERLGFEANSIYFAKKEEGEEDIKLSIYPFDFSEFEQPEFQYWPPTLQPLGLFLLST